MKDFRNSLGTEKDYICTDCKSDKFALWQPLDNIFPDVVCLKCGSIRQRLKGK